MGFVAPVAGNSTVVAIDLGTVSSKVAVLNHKGNVVLIPNERGKYATPTCVAFSDGRIFIGATAEEQVDGNLENTIFAPQRLIGFKYGHPLVQWYMKLQPTQVLCGDNDSLLIRVKPKDMEILLRPEEIVAILLKYLRMLAEKFLGRVVADAVITVPSSFGNVQRQALLLSCRWAGLRVRKLVSSPTAAAVGARRIGFLKPPVGKATTDERQPECSQKQILVCDIGGTYFDYAFLGLEQHSGQQPRLTERMIGTELFDLDACLTRLCVQDLRDKHSVNLGSSPRQLMRLRRACEQAKRNLSYHHQACVDVKEIVGSRDYVCHVSREQFESVCQDDIDALLSPISWCLEEIGMNRDEIDDVVLVGGSARIPKIRSLLRDYFYGKTSAEMEHPDTIVVIGAAVYAAMLSPRGYGQVPHDIMRIQIVQVQVTPWANLRDHEELESERHPSMSGSGSHKDRVEGRKSFADKAPEEEELGCEGADGFISFL